MITETQDQLSNTSNEKEYLIFTDVRALLSMTVIKILPKNFESNFENDLDIKIELKNEIDEIQYSFIGTLESIIQAQTKIQKLIKDTLLFKTNENDIKKHLDNENSLLDIAEIRSISPLKPKFDKLKSKKTALKNPFCIISKVKSNDTKVIQRRSNRLNAGLKYKASMKEWSIRTVQEKQTPKNEHCEKITEARSKVKKSDKDARESSNKNDQSNFKHFCEICSFKTKRISHLNKHLAIHSKVTSLFRCHHCSFTTVRLGHLRRHELSHSNTVQACELCPYQTDELKLLLRHVKLKHNLTSTVAKTSQVLQCDKCPYKSEKRHLMERHLRIHGVRSHQCELCCYRTWRKEHFVRHVNNVHKNKRPYLCHLCGKAFKRGDALRQHQMTHAEENDDVENMSTYHCDTCNKTFRSQSHLFEHNAVHSNDRSFLCEICGASFKTRSVQRKHVQTIHKNPRAHSCSFCSKRFNTLYSLKRHLKVHSVENASENSISNALDNTTITEEDCGGVIITENRTLTNKRTILVGQENNKQTNIDMLTLDSKLAAANQFTIEATVTRSSYQENAVIAEDNIPSVLQGTEVTNALLYLTNSLI